MRTVLERLVRCFVPEGFAEDAVTQRAARRAIVFGLAMVVWAPVFAPIYYLLGSMRACVMVGLVGCAILGAMASLRFTHSVVLTGHLIAGSVFAVLFGLACITGGMGSPALWWLTAVPIIGLILCGVPSGIAWAGLSCLLCLGFLLLDLAGIPLAEDIGREHMQLLNWAATSGIILCAFSLTLAFKLGEDVARIELEAARRESEQANKAKSAFLANMSHEIRTPMNAVIGMTELVLGTELTRQQREYLDVACQSSEALLALLNDILDFSRIEADKLQLDVHAFDLHDCVADTMRSLGVSAHQKGLELICDIRPEVPKPVLGDSNRLRQIIVNLVGNAIKFTEVGEVVLLVECDSRTEQDTCLRFSVRDTGIGIPQEKQQVIFGLFEQADASTTRRFGGTGLGLAICSRLVQMMQGQIHVESELGHGSTFHFTARFGVADEQEVPRRALQPVTIHDTRVLVVDDNATNRRILDEVLRSWGIQPDLVEDAHQALGLIHHALGCGEPYRLVLTDSHMPDIDGFMLAEQIRAHPELDSTVIMMLTSGDSSGDLTRCERLKIASYLLKPVKQTELFDEMLRTLGVTTTEDDRTERQAVDALQVDRSWNVLLVEDSPMNQKLACAVLEKQQHRVIVANNGREACELWCPDVFDVILMDVQMPEMDGFEATRFIREQEQKLGGHVPIIAMTAHALRGDRERCLEAGMDEYVSKPIHARQLLETIRSLVRERPRRSLELADGG
jgi:signal transduction histidine kinase/DNA-binding response OmpR family regulator